MPETPEGVALYLLCLILSREIPHGDNRSVKDRVLALYFECLALAEVSFRQAGDALH